MEYIQKLLEKLGKEKVHREDFVRYAYAMDWSPRTIDEVFLPDVVVRPTSTEDVVSIVKIGYEHNVPIVAGGGLTGMAGGAIAKYGGIYIDTTTMNKVIEIDEENQVLRAQAGITLQEINDALEKHRLWLPNLPESKWACTLGATIACDNDSTFGLKYGKILHSLLSAKFVTGTGDVIEVGHRKVHFSSSGYKLLHLLAGSEGTLGIITEATVKAQPIPEYRRVEMFLFKRMKDGIKFLSELLANGLSIEGAHINCKRRVRFYTRAYKEKYGKEPRIPEWVEALLILIFAGKKEFVDFQFNYAFESSKRYNAELVEEREIVESWWTSKHTLNFEPYKQKWALSQKEKKFGACDPGVPMGNLEKAYELFIKTAEKYKLEPIGMNAYLEHPNSIGLSLSCAVYVDYRNSNEVKNFRKYHEEMAKIAVDLGGTMSTYMGDSDLKADYLEYEHCSATKYMKELKKIFDPKGIMNPGKKFNLSSFQ
ncbi:MAG: FAD-binding oxidoreductase [Candidatus Thermoplasmatota archaeon]